MQGFQSDKNTCNCKFLKPKAEYQNLLGTNNLKITIQSDEINA